MKKKEILSFIIAVWVLIPGFSPRELQGQQDIHISIDQGMPMAPVAMPEFHFAPGSIPDQETKNSLHQIMWNDLSYSRVFKLTPKEHYNYITKFDPENIVYKDWASLQANILVVGQVEVAAGDRIVFTIKVYDVQSERFIFGRNFGGKKDLIRLMAHRASDAIMAQFGEKALFTSKIVFASSRDGNEEIYIMDYDGERQTRITYNQDLDMLPTWSVDREKILYTSYRKNNPDLYMFHLFTGKTELVATGKANYSADWSREGDLIVYTSTRSGNAEIYVRDMKSSKEKQLTFSSAIDTSPCWSPNSREIAFVSNRSGAAQIYIMDAEGSNIRRITSEGMRHDSPDWSPDGSMLAYTLMFNGGIDIYVYHLKNNSIRKLTEANGINETPSWSPDGRHLLFSSNSNGSYQIYSIDYDGQNLRQLTSKGNNKTAYWQK